MLRAHHIRLDPTAAQEDYFRRACGTARFAYNWALARWEEQYKAGGKPSEVALRRELNAIKDDQFPWIREVTKNAIQQAVKNLGTAYANAFARAKKGQRRGKKNPFGFPRFKKKGRHDSFRADNGPHAKGMDAVKVDGPRVQLSRCGWVRMREEVRFSGQIKSCTISRKAEGWYAALIVETEDRLRAVPDATEAVGVDLGVKTLATLSTGEAVANPKPLGRLLGKLGRLNRSLSRKRKGGKNREQAKTKLSRLHLRIRNVRADALHKLTTRLATQYETVAIEDLHVAGMVQNRHLSHALSDCGFGELRRQLEYKCEMTGARVCVVDRFYPSSKTCSGCGTVQEMPLSQRTFSCACGLVIDRDHNAALNLWRQALPLQSVERPALTAPRGDVKLVLVKQKKVGLYRNVQTL